MTEENADGGTVTAVECARMVEQVKQHMLDYVDWVVQRVVSVRPPGWSVEDMQQETLLFALAWADRYDPSKPANPRTYAIAWLRYGALNALNRNLPVPPGVEELRRHARSRRKLLRRKLGRDPTEQEVADALGVTLQRLRSARRPVIVSLDDTVGGAANSDETDFSYHDVLTDDTREDVEASVIMYCDARGLADKVDDLLTPRELLVLRECTIGERTYQDLANDIGLSRERIRQQGREALGVLRLFVDG